MGFLAALGGAGGAAGAGGATGATAGAGAGTAAGASAAAPTALMGAAPATSAAGPATAMSAFGGIGAPTQIGATSALGAGNAGLMQQILSGMSSYGGGVLNPGKGEAGQGVFGALNQGQLPKFSDAVKYATQLAINDALFGRRRQMQQDFTQQYRR